jgi:hypothetical protein
MNEFTLFPRLPIAIRHRIFSCVDDNPYYETYIHAIRGFPDHILEEKRGPVGTHERSTSIFTEQILILESIGIRKNILKGSFERECSDLTRGFENDLSHILMAILTPCRAPQAFSSEPTPMAQR